MWGWGEEERQAIWECSDAEWMKRGWWGVGGVVGVAIFSHH